MLNLKDKRHTITRHLSRSDESSVHYCGGNLKLVWVCRRKSWLGQTAGRGGLHPHWRQNILFLLRQLIQAGLSWSSPCSINRDGGRFCRVPARLGVFWKAYQ